MFHYRYLHNTARNLAAAVTALHARGYLIGDVNESNVLVSDTSWVTLVDTDSFQVRDPNDGHVFRCLVGKPEFTPPELMGKRFSDIDRLPEHDMFGVAVLLFKLLMEGTHPVGRKNANAWGLYDMQGNVWEWCQDWYGGYESGDVVDPPGNAQGSFRVLRGGCWDRDALDCRPAFRSALVPTGRWYIYGFRLALSLSTDAPQGTQ